MKTKLLLCLLLGCLSACTPYYYKQALQDASVPQKQEETTTLTEISKNNPALVWKNIGGEDHVLVLTWKSAEAPRYYVNDKKTGVYHTGSRTLFVTAVPDLQRWFEQQKKRPNADPSKRIKQLLGLSPDKNLKYQYFVECWVRPRDLLRPCFDAEVHDNTCAAGFPDKPVDCEYLKWLSKYSTESYANNSYLKNFPFTRLGYTYDWHPKNKKHIGLSEFIIPAGKDIVIERIVSTRDYLKL